MELKDAIGILEKEASFNGWRGKHKDAFFAHAYVMEKPEGREWELGYFDPHDNMMEMFTIKDSKVSHEGATPVARAENAPPIKEVRMEEIQLTVGQAIERAEEIRKKEYSAEAPLRTFIIVQCIESGCIYNVTFFTKSFNVVNVKVSSKDGSVLRHSKEAMISGFGK